LDRAVEGAAARDHHDRGRPRHLPHVTDELDAAARLVDVEVDQRDGEELLREQAPRVRARGRRGDDEAALIEERAQPFAILLRAVHYEELTAFAHGSPQRENGICIGSGASPAGGAGKRHAPTCRARHPPRASEPVVLRTTFALRTCPSAGISKPITTVPRTLSVLRDSCS